MIETPGGLKRLEAGDYVAPALYEADSAFNTLVDRVETAVPHTRTVNGHALSNDVTLTAEDVGAAPTSRTVNGKPLSQDVTLTPADVGAVPTTRRVNGHALSSDVALTAADVGAAGQMVNQVIPFTTYSNGLITYSNYLSGYMRDQFGRVDLWLTFSTTSGYFAGRTVVGILPEGYRTLYPIHAIGNMWSDQIAGNILVDQYIATNGEVVFYFPESSKYNRASFYISFQAE